MNRRRQPWNCQTEIELSNRWFLDEHGRVLILRGVNCSGICKIPINREVSDPANTSPSTHPDTISFVGRPFAEGEAEKHFERLKLWGLTFLRFLIPWEALEHAGPGIYDEEYIEYVCRILGTAEKLGFKVFIDPHMDVFSRYSGGTGAPRWTFDLVGLDTSMFEATGAAVIQSERHPDNYLPMIWPTNLSKLACATMYTLFFGGDVFAPHILVKDVPVQQYLQDHYCQAYSYLAKKVKMVGLNCVIGFDTMNEPHWGYIGVKDLNQFNWKDYLLFGENPSALEGMALADGLSLSVDYWDRDWFMPTAPSGRVVVNPQHTSVWKRPEGCIWRSAGVWDRQVDSGSEKPILLKPDYFCRTTDGRSINFNQDFLCPFLIRFCETIHLVDQHFIVFIEGAPGELPPKLDETQRKHLGRIVFAPHWYDLKMVFEKAFTETMTVDVQALRKVGRMHIKLFFANIC